MQRRIDYRFRPTVLVPVAERLGALRVGVESYEARDFQVAASLLRGNLCTISFCSSLPSALFKLIRALLYQKQILFEATHLVSFGPK